jgi:hypothetical protein
MLVPLWATVQVKDVWRTLATNYRTWNKHFIWNEALKTRMAWTYYERIFILTFLFMSSEQFMMLYMKWMTLKNTEKKIPRRTYKVILFCQLQYRTLTRHVLFLNSLDCTTSQGKKIDLLWWQTMAVRSKYIYCTFIVKRLLHNFLDVSKNIQ